MQLSNHREQSLSRIYEEYVGKILASLFHRNSEMSLSEVMCCACRIDYGRAIEICLSNFSTVLTSFFLQNTTRIYQSLAVAVDLNCCVSRDISRLESYFTRKNILKGIKLH